MQLFCKYGADASDPSKGFVFAHHDDGQVVAEGAYPGCMLVSYSGRLEDLGKFGPEPPKGVSDMRSWAAPNLDLSLLRTVTRADLSASCGREISGGFTSAALGTPNVYPSSEEDQRNLILAAGSAITGQSTPGWSAALKCGMPVAAAVRQPHSAAQIHQVLTDFQSFKEKLTAKLDALNAEILSPSATAASISAITWG